MSVPNLFCASREVMVSMVTSITVGAVTAIIAGSLDQTYTAGKWPQQGASPPIGILGGCVSDAVGGGSSRSQGRTRTFTSELRQTWTLLFMAACVETMILPMEFDRAVEYRA